MTAKLRYLQDVKSNAVLKPVLRLRVPSILALLVVLAPSRASYAQDFSQQSPRPDPSAALIQQANTALAGGDYTTALRILTILEAQTPNNAQILYDLGMTLEAMDQQNGPGAVGTQEAGLKTDAPVRTPESCYRAAVAADGTFAPAHVALGLLLARTGAAKEARTELLTATKLPEIDPALAAHAYRALAQLDQFATPPDFATASSELLAALKLSPEQPGDILQAAQLAGASSDLTAAEQAYRRYLALPGDAKDPQAIAALAHILILQNHFSEAASLLTSALAASPEQPALTALLAEAYLNSGDAAQITAATPLVESLHKKIPDNAAITRMLARIFLETGHPEQADPLYAELIEDAQGHPDATLLDNRAEVLLHLHRPGEAEKLLKQAVADRAGFPSASAFGDAAMRLAFAAEEIDDPRTTLQALALRATVLPPSPSSLFLEATAHDDLHHSTQAAESYRQFLAAAHGTLPDQESQARRRLLQLEHSK